MKVLVTGATGYIGGQLVPRLLDEGHSVRCMVRHASRPLPSVFKFVKVVEADPLRPETLPAALEDMEAAYYLIHSMSGGEEGFEERDRRAACNFAVAAKAAGVQRVIYLGGLITPGSIISEHLKSRKETGAVLRNFGPPLTELRAGIIVGNGSISFEIIRTLTERLPVMICPRWVVTRTQPIAVDDVVRYLVAALETPESAGQIVEIGGRTVETYRSMMLDYARERGLRRWMVRVPVLTPRLSSYWLDLVTPFPPAITRPLIEGLRSEAVCTSAKAEELFPALRPISYEQALREALSRSGPETFPLAELPADVGHWIAREQGMICDTRQMIVHACAEEVFHLLESAGGRNGWFFGNMLWRLRGWLDRLLGGPGMSRGRANTQRLNEGDVVDCWRVERVARNRMLMLRAELKLPGEAWLEFEVLPQAGSRALLRSRAWFRPHGLSGEVYWAALYPAHAFLFSGMMKAIKRAAERARPVWPEIARAQ
jgi:uncharacterized protein YbjT (DUF2867 family)